MSMALGRHYNFFSHMNINHSFVTLETRSHWTVEYTKTFEDYVIFKKKKKPWKILSKD